MPKLFLMHLLRLLMDTAFGAVKTQPGHLERIWVMPGLRVIHMQHSGLLSNNLWKAVDKGSCLGDGVTLCIN